MLAIVGRPNVGKSALVNRILGRREAVVEDTPGVTRDRVTYKARVDRTAASPSSTPAAGSPTPRASTPPSPRRPRSPIDLADAVLFVVDANVGATSTDEHVVRMLRASEAARSSSSPTRSTTRVRSPRRPRCGASASASRGRSRAVHGRGVADLLDDVMTVLPEISAVAKEEVGGPRRVAILGRPNVGKSSLLNKAAGEERVVVNELAGTTRDPVDEQVELGGKLWRFVDTAGIRRRVHLQQGADFYASLRTSAALEKAEVAVVVLDVTEPISEQDVRIIDLVLESGRALVLAFNKWDLLDDERRRYLEREIEQDLAHVAWAPRVNISARTGRHLEKLVPALEIALDIVGHPHPDRQVQRASSPSSPPSTRTRVRGGKQPRILFGTQASTPPADVRAVHDRLPRPAVPPLHPAPPARDLRLRGHADRRQHAGAREALEEAMPCPCGSGPSILGMLRAPAPRGRG